VTNPCPGHDISTPYGKEGSAWGCGWHDGADFAAPSGTDVVAAWGGTVVEAAYPTSFGAAFGRAVVIDHDKLPDGSPGLWGLYAHLSAENVSVGQRVEAGQKIGDVGTTGNSSGNHLHFGIYAQPSWCSGCGKNPQPWIEAGDMGSNNYDYDYLDKPSGTLEVGRSYVKLDQSTWDPPRSGWEHTYVYLNIAPTFQSGKAYGALRLRIVRADGDTTGHQDILIAQGMLDDDGRTLHHVLYWEAGDGKKTHIELKCQGGLQSARIGTRYVKKAVVVD